MNKFEQLIYGNGGMGMVNRMVNIVICASFWTRRCLSIWNEWDANSWFGIIWDISLPNKICCMLQDNLERTWIRQHEHWVHPTKPLVEGARLSINHFLSIDYCHCIVVVLFLEYSTTGALSQWPLQSMELFIVGYLVLVLDLEEKLASSRFFESCVAPDPGQHLLDSPPPYCCSSLFLEVVVVVVW